MRRGIVLGVVVIVGTLSVSLRALPQLNQAAVDAAEIEQVKNNLYVITGSSPINRDLFSGGNVGVFVMEDGVAIVDSKLPGWGQVILDRIRTVTDKPVTTIINTHTHGDHVGSNDFFPDTVNIVAHENTKTNMMRMDNFQGDNAEYLPKQTYTDRLTLGSGDDRIDLYYFGKGHTDGDTFIVYPALGVLQTGDMFPWRDAPFLDVNNGGSGIEFPDTLGRALTTIRGVDTVVPGHIPVTTWASFEEYRRFTSELLAQIRAAKGRGLSADEAVSEIDMSARPPVPRLRHQSHGGGDPRALRRAAVSLCRAGKEPSRPRNYGSDLRRVSAR